MKGPDVLKKFQDILGKLFSILGAIQNIICQMALLRQRHLISDAAQCLGSRESVSFLETGHLGFAIGSHNDDLIHSFVDAGFEEQRDIVNYDDMRVSSGSLSGESGLFPSHTRVDDSFELSQLRPIMKHNLPESLSVDGLITVQDGPPKSAHNVSPSRFALPDNLTRQFIGIDHDGAEFLEHLCHGAFSSGDASRESDQDHGGGAYHAIGSARNP